MMEYGMMINNQLIIHKERHDGDKPVKNTEPPYQEGYRAIYHYRESDEITQVWELVENHDTPEPPKPEEAGIDDYAEQLERFGVE